MADETTAKAPEVAQPTKDVPAASVAGATATESGAPTTDAKPAETEPAPTDELVKREKAAKNTEDDKPAEGTCRRYRVVEPT